MDEAFGGKEFYRKSNSVKRFRPFSESPDSEKLKASALIGKFRRGSNTVITPFKTHRADFKIEEDRGNYVFFSEPFLGNFRDAGVFRNFWADGLFGWTRS